MKRSVFIFLVLGFGLLSACYQARGTSQVTGVRQDGQGSPGSPVEMLTLINQARSESRRCGDSSFPATHPLASNDLLCLAAKNHSIDMAGRNFFSHRGSDGQLVGRRIEKSGYRARSWGENISAGSPTARETVARWLQSPGHCANIMNPDYSEMGSAVGENSSTAFKSYWTLVLATPR